MIFTSAELGDRSGNNGRKVIRRTYAQQTREKPHKLHCGHSPIALPHTPATSTTVSLPDNIIVLHNCRKRYSNFRYKSQNPKSVHSLPLGTLTRPVYHNRKSFANKYPAITEELRVFTIDNKLVVDPSSFSTQLVTLRVSRFCFVGHRKVVETASEGFTTCVGFLPSVPPIIPDPKRDTILVS